ASVDPDAAFGWTMGRLVCDDRPLTEIVADLNRRYATPIALSPRAARMRFSGVLDLADQDALVDRLAKYLALNVDRGGGKITLR
ncbi:MAG TPA: iron dicitrate transport regulator FecR, partial [Phenylobacterium sp.]|nr:iron dicitrate transport regulator FecR [Phenylobacterium sp.]